MLVIDATVEDSNLVIEVAPGEEIPVRYVRTTGQFEALYRGRRLTGTVLHSLRTQAEWVRADAMVKAARAQALKEAAARPLPALLIVDGDLERVDVRGLDRRSGAPLITRADGQKDTCRRGDLLRPLAAEEAAEVRAAIAEVRRTVEASLAVQPVRTINAHRDIDATVEVRYVADVDQWVGEYEGETFASDSVAHLKLLIEEAATKRAYPYAVGPDGIEHASEWPQSERFHYGYRGLFRTRDEGERFLVAAQRNRHAIEALADLRKKYALDLSAFEG